MPSNDDKSGKGPSKPGTEAAPKKPSAIIDLKPSGVNVKDLKDNKAQSETAGADAAKPQTTKPEPTTKDAPASTRPAAGPSAGGAGSQSAANDDAARAAKGEPGPGATKPASATGSDKATTTQTDKQSSPATTSPPTSHAQAKSPASAATRSAAGGNEAAAAAASAPPPKRRSSGGGIWSTFTHLVAGVIGGALVLFGADKLPPELGLPLAGSSQQTDALDRRLASLESRLNQSGQGTATLEKKLSGAEARLADLEKLRTTVASLEQRQSVQSATTKSLGEKIAQASTTQADDARVTDLEQRLNALVKAGSADPAAAPIAKLAAITGRIADLESSVDNQLAGLRTSLMQEVDKRVADASEAGEAARSGTQRLDRELSRIRTDGARSIERIASLQRTAEQLQGTLQAVKDEAASIKRSVADVKSELARELQQVAKLSDLKSALSPVTGRISDLEQGVKGVVQSEDQRRATARRIILALELGNLKRTIERGAPYPAELSEVQQVADPKLDLTTLERYKDRGVPTLTQLQREFRPLAFDIVEADQHKADANWSDRLLSGAKSLVRIRRTDQDPKADGVEAIVARIEAALKNGRLIAVTQEAQKLSPKAREPAQQWLDEVAARAAIDRAIAELESQLKASLGTTANDSGSGKEG